MTLIEVLVAIAVCAIVAMMVILSVNHPDRGGPRVQCMSQLRQVDSGFLLFADVNKGKLPMQLAVSNGGTMEFVYSNATYAQYQKLAAYLIPKTLICPEEKQRRAVMNFSDLTETNLSYFLNADASLTNSPAASILSGDRNLEASGRPVSPGLFILTTNLNMNWTRELHPWGGNVAFADGHVEFCRTNKLNAMVERQSIVTNRLLVP